MTFPQGRARISVLVVLGAVAWLVTVSVGTAGSAPSSGRFEVNVMNQPKRGGEPELAVNPRNPNNVVLGHTVVGNTYANNTLEARLQEGIPGSLQVSNDGGKTWGPDRSLKTSGYSEPANPFLIAQGLTGATGFTLDSDGVGDPVEASGPDGSIYAGGVMAHAAPPGPAPFNFTVAQGAIAVFRSTNGGKSFGKLSPVLSDQELKGMVDRAMTPQLTGFGVNPFDRPWIAVDQSNGTVYVSTTAHPQRYVVASTDKAKTFGRIEALDCDEASPPDANHHVTCGAYPESGGGNIDAAHGVLAAAYIASAAPGSTCPCAVFETSVDSGAHWTRHVAATVPDGSNVFVAADPAHRGHFAVMLLPGAKVAGGLPGLSPNKNVPQTVQVLTTTDSGNTWSSPISLGNESTPHITNKPWIAYGPNGVLAALWRNAYQPYNPATIVLTPGTQNVFAAISRDNGKTFSAPVKLNSAPSPPPDPTQLAEDDVSWVLVTPKYVYGAWGDWRPTTNNPVAAGSSPPSGELNSWIARVPLSDFPRQ